MEREQTIAGREADPDLREVLAKVAEFRARERRWPGARARTWRVSREDDAEEAKLAKQVSTAVREFVDRLLQ